MRRSRHGRQRKRGILYSTSTRAKDRAGIGFTKQPGGRSNLQRRDASTTEKARLFPGNALTRRGNARAYIGNENRASTAPAFPYSLERTVSRRATRYTANNVIRLTTGWSANVARLTNRGQCQEKIKRFQCKLLRLPLVYIHWFLAFQNRFGTKYLYVRKEILNVRDFD